MSNVLLRLNKYACNADFDLVPSPAAPAYQAIDKPEELDLMQLERCDLHRNSREHIPKLLSLMAKVDLNQGSHGRFLLD